MILGLPPEMLVPVAVGLSSTFVLCILIVLTKRWHGTLTLDHYEAGTQKVHDLPTPRVGGCAVFAGLWAAASVSPPIQRELLAVLGVSGLVAFLAGLADDLTKHIAPKWRLLATLFAGLTFCIITREVLYPGYSVIAIDIGFIDSWLALPAVSFVVSAVMIGGVTNGMNMIDGFNGLASGVTVIILSAVAAVAGLNGDSQMAWLVVTVGAILVGFMLVNFPYGHVFLGDGGAYLTGFLVGTLGVMLHIRSPDVSPWVVATILLYPALDAIHAVIRKTIRPLSKATGVDRVHLHMLVHKRFTKRLVEREKVRLRNPLTSVLLWGWPLLTLALVFLFPHTRAWWLPTFVCQVVLYFWAYRRLALLRHQPLLSLPKALP